ncbi:MAG: ABC transporter permease [Chloroflexi bacterium]|nr:MAG: ATPase [Phototrophicales bacterium]RMF80780.1 MAG: ABC transporter permease [Chloroflexota bacterium]
MNTIKRYLRPEQIRELSLIVIIVIALLIFGTQINNYFSIRTFNRISASVMIITVLAVGQTLVVLTRNIDLSVGSIVGLTAYVAGDIISKNNDLDPLLLVLIAMGIGAGFGIVNGLLVAYGNIPAVIVTLGTLAIYRGLLVEISNAQSILVSNMPDWVGDLPRVNLLTIGDFELRVLVAIAIATVILFQLMLTYLPYGRRLYAIGSNPEAAHVAGLPARRIVFIAYILSGALAGLAGFMFLARFGTITVGAGVGLELQVVAAVVVGGVNIFGGTGTMIGAMLGSVLIGTLEQSLIRMNINEFWKDALLGLFILLAIVSDALILNRLRDLWTSDEMELRVDSEKTQAPVSIEHKETGHVAKP